MEAEQLIGSRSTMLPVPTRRTFMLGLAAVPLTLAMRAPAAEARKGPYRGAAVMPHLLADAAFARQLVADCDCLTPELHLKWSAVEPQQAAHAFTEADQIADFARRHGKRMRGHTLLWHRSIPGWAAPLIRTGKWVLIERHIGALIPRYTDLVDEWDVVNEPIDADEGSGGLRRNAFLEGFGSGYVERALHEAHQHAPGATLMLNEYGLEPDGAWADARRLAMLRLVERLRARGAPIGGIGVQAHLEVTTRPNYRAFGRFLRELEQLGMRVSITELDVRETDRSASTAERDRQVASTAEAFLDTAMANTAVSGVTTWGLTDTHSWLQQEDPETYAAAAARPVEGDRLNRGLPLDSRLKPKPLAAVISKAMQSASSILS
jgi:endo-1,4-beta-xylanase